MKRSTDLGSDKIWKLVVKLGVPAMIGQFVAVLYSIVDRIFIGNMPEVGAIALSGVGVTNPITTLIISFSFLVGLGGAPLVAMKLGEKKPEEAQSIVSNALIMLLIVSAIITTIILSVKKPMLYFFGASDNTYGYANDYLTIYAAGAVFGILSTGLNSFITCQGFSTTSMMTVLIGALLNIILDPLLIFTCKLGVKGAALATIISQAASCIWVILFLLSKKSNVKLSFKGLSGSLMIKIVKLGFSPFMIISTDSVMIIIFNILLKKYGGADADMLVAGGVITLSFMQLITLPMGGITLGCQPIVSYNYGAGNFDRVKKGFLGMNTYTVIFTTIMTILSFTVGEYFVSLFTDNEFASKIAVWGIKVYALGIIPLALQYACVDGLTALGQPKFAISLSLVRKLVVMMIFLFTLPIFMGYKGVFYAEPFADIFAGIAATITTIIVLPKILKKPYKGF